jgi:hypothetical protein
MLKLFCPDCHVLPVLSFLSCRGCPDPIVLCCRPVRGLLRLSCPSCHAIALLSLALQPLHPLFAVMFRPSCPVLAVRFLAVLSWLSLPRLSCACYPVHPILSSVLILTVRTGLSFSAVLSWLFFLGCPVPNALCWLSIPTVLCSVPALLL